MKCILVSALVILLAACNEKTAEGRKVEKIDGPNPKGDTGQLITDSVAVPDTTTADIDPLKKRN